MPGSALAHFRLPKLRLGRDAIRAADGFRLRHFSVPNPRGRAYQRARTRYLRTEVPSLATGTLNWAAKAAVFVYL